MGDRIISFNKVTPSVFEGSSKRNLFHSNFDYMNTFLSKSIKKTYKPYQLKKLYKPYKAICIGKGWLILVKYWLNSLR